MEVSTETGGADDGESKAAPSGAKASKKCSDWPLLSAAEQNSRMTAIPSWQIVPNEEGITQLHRRVVCKNFVKAMEAINAAASAAETRNHHPGMPKHRDVLSKGI